MKNNTSFGHPLVGDQYTLCSDMYGHEFTVPENVKAQASNAEFLQAAIEGYDNGKLHDNGYLVLDKTTGKLAFLVSVTISDDVTIPASALAEISAKHGVTVRAMETGFAGKDWPPYQVLVAQLDRVEQFDAAYDISADIVAAQALSAGVTTKADSSAKKTYTVCSDIYGENISVSPKMQKTEANRDFLEAVKKGYHDGQLQGVGNLVIDESGTLAFVVNVSWTDDVRATEEMKQVLADMSARHGVDVRVIQSGDMGLDSPGHSLIVAVLDRVEELSKAKDIGEDITDQPIFFPGAARKTSRPG
jgi:predicted amino acid-binding ACT domain protein